MDSIFQLGVPEWKLLSARAHTMIFRFIVGKPRGAVVPVSVGRFTQIDDDGLMPLFGTSQLRRCPVSSIGNRLIAAHPDWLQWQIIQNANTYEEGFTAAWDGIRHALWVNRNADTEAPLEGFLQPETVKAIYTSGHPDLSKISPDNWNTDLFFLSRPRAHRVQLDLFYDYRTNAALYPTWQQSLRERQPLTLIFWGQGDIFFTPAGGEAYLRDLPDAELVRLDSGHFAVEDNLQQIADGITLFYDTRVGPAVHAVTG